jgi:glycosyltransferase involved in cell wall biosynthesis
MTGNPYISIVVPVKNEEECIADLAAEVTAALCASGYAWECIWVNDGSTDTTAHVLTQLNADEPRHRIVSHTESCGQSAALATGFSHARGGVIGTMDGDGQNNPRDFLPLLARLESGEADMVNGIRRNRRDTFIRRFSSRAANGFRRLMLGDSVSDIGCAIRVFRKECVTGLPLFKGLHRFLPILAGFKGYTITEITVDHRPRTRGKTKYGVNNRLWVGLADTFAVMWMKRRLVFPVEAPEHASEDSSESLQNRELQF